MSMKRIRHGVLALGAVVAIVIRGAAVRRRRPRISTAMLSGTTDSLAQPLLPDVSSDARRPGQDETPVLLAIYQADRAQTAADTGIVFAMFGVGVAYLSATF